MRRSDALEPLSHDHHAGLVFVARLRAAQRAGDDPAPLAAEVAAFWRGHLVPHFQDEEALVLPLLERGAPALAAQMLDEHRQIRQLVEAASGAPAGWGGPLGSVAGVLAAHIRFEERQAFPAAERLAGDALADLRTRIHDAHTSRPPSP